MPIQKTEDTRPKKEKKGLSYKEKLELGEVERSIERLDARKKEVEGMLANPPVFANDTQKLRETGEEFGRIEEFLSGQLKRWEELEGKKD